MSESLEELVKKAKEKSKTFQKEDDIQQQDKDDEENKIEDGDILKKDETFEKLGVCPEICEAISKMGFKHPSKIQAESLPYTL